MPILDHKEFADRILSYGRVTQRLLKSEYGTVRLFYIKQLNDIDSLTLGVIKPLLDWWHFYKKPLDPKTAFSEVFYTEDIELTEDEKQAEEFILSGMTLALFEGYGTAVKINIKKVESTSPSEAELNYSVWGAKDSFTENMDANLSLIQYRIKDKNLALDSVNIGRRTKSGVLIAYIKGVANEGYVNNVKNRIEKIDIDGISESGKLAWYLKDSPLSPFPQCGMEQRADAVCAAMLEGKIAVLLEGSPVALVCPKVFIEFFRTDEDECNNIFFSVFSKLLRIIACAISLLASPVYIALMAFHSSAVPTQYLMSLASARAGVPFSVVGEIVLMEILVEILRECLMRIPKNAGTAIGIVGGIVIGSAAVDAGIISPAVLVIVALSLMCSFVVPDYAFTNTIRTFKPLFIILAAFFGIIGSACAMLIFIFGAVKLSSLSVPYMVPYSPFRAGEALKGIYNTSFFSFTRPGYLKSKNKIRQKL